MDAKDKPWQGEKKERSVRVNEAAFAFDPGAIIDSLERLAEVCPDPTPHVYARLFAEHPELEPLFILGPQAKGHMLDQVINVFLDMAGPQTYAPALMLAERVNHDQLGVPPAAFITFFDTAARTFESLLGSDWTPAYAATWAGMLQSIDAGFAAREMSDH